MANRQGTDYWRSHVEDWRQSRLSQIAYCEQHGLNIKSFRRWRTRLQADAVVPPALTLVPVSVNATQTAPVVHLRSPAGWHIELPLTQTDNPMPWLAQLLRQLP